MINKSSELIRLIWSVFIVQQAEEIIQNIFSSFKLKLNELKWTDQKSIQFVMKKVTCEARNVIVFCLFELHFDINKGLSSSRFSL